MQDSDLKAWFDSPQGRPVPMEGPPQAAIMLVGEAPGENEAAEGRPFVGLSGRLLDGMLREAGIDRSQCAITNVVNQRPPQNDFEVFEEGYGQELYRQNLVRLAQEIATVRPNVIVCLGAKALEAVTLKKGITKWRGSVVPATLVPGFKAIAVYHPAAVGRMYEWRPVAVMDLGRAAGESEFPDIRRRDRDLRVGLDFQGCVAALEQLRSLGPERRLSFDIETASRQVVSIGFSTSPSSAVCIPFFWDGQSCWTAEEEVALWELVTAVLAGPTAKIVQNGAYDLLFLRDVMAIEVNNVWMDTMLAHHTCYPEFDKGLDFLCSMYTDHPYYKDGLNAKDPLEFALYNCLDACITYECAEEILKELREFKVERFYFDHVHRLLEPLIRIGARGIRIDHARRDEAVRTYTGKLLELQAALERVVGHPLNVNSPKQMSAFLYTELKHESQTKVRKVKNSDEKKSTETTDEATIRKLAAAKPHPAYDIILEIRERRKILSTYLEADVDSDGRMRTSYNIAGTRTGRLSSRQTIYGTGLNIQNVPPGIARSLFISDPGTTFVQGDLSQAEARVVAYLAEDERLIRVFDDGGDIHRRNASIIFGCTEAEVTPTQRQLAKKIVHASNYGMGPRRFKEVCFEEAGIEVSEAEAKRLLNLYMSQFHGIPRWHLDVQASIKKTRVLTTPFGRKRQFWGYLSDDLFREAYAYVPQSTVVDHLNKALLGLDARAQAQPQLGLAIAMQIHDALIVQCADDRIPECIETMRYFMETPLTIKHRDCLIPVEFKVGKCWDELKGWPA